MSLKVSAHVALAARARFCLRALPASQRVYSTVHTGPTPLAVPGSSIFPASHLTSELGPIAQSYHDHCHLRAYTRQIIGPSAPWGKGSVFKVRLPGGVNN
jgi:hypothetical protein